MHVKMLHLCLNFKPHAACSLKNFVVNFDTGCPKDASFLLNKYQDHVRLLNFEFSRENRDCENRELAKAWRSSFNKFSQIFVWQRAQFFHMKNGAIWWQTASPSLYLQASVNSQFS